KFSADGRRITALIRDALGATGGARMLIFDGQTAAMIRDLGSPQENEQALVSPHGTWLLLVPRDDGTRARLLSSDTGFATALELPAGGNHDAWFSPDERKLVISSAGSVSLWDIAGASLLKSCSIAGETDWIVNGAFSPDGASFAALTQGG